MSTSLVVAMYARVSSDEQRDRETIQNQRLALAEHCQARGYTVGSEFLDDGVSGSVPFGDRPAGAELLERAGEFDRVVVLRYDRLGRDVLQSLLVLEALKRAGVSVESVREDFDDSPGGRFARNNMLGVAELERELIKERTSAGRNRAVTNGLYHSRTPPFGYRRVNAVYEGGKRKEGTGVLVIDEEEAGWVRRVFDWSIDENMGLHALAHRLEAEGAPLPQAPHGRKYAGGWSYNSVWYILKSRRYTGEAPYGEKAIAMHCPPIVSVERWEEAQAALARRRSTSTRNQKRFYLLGGGILRCGVCGGSMTGSAVTGKKMRDYGYIQYECSNRRRNGPKAGHEGVRWRYPASKIEPVVKAAIDDIVRDPEATFARADVEWQRMERELDAAPDALEDAQRRFDACQVEEREVITMRARGLIDDEQVGDQLQRIRAERDRAKQDASAARGDAEEADALKATIAGLREWAASTPPAEGYLDEDTGEIVAEMTPQAYRARLEALAARVVVESDGSIRIEGPGGACLFQTRSGR